MALDKKGHVDRKHRKKHIAQREKGLRAKQPVKKLKENVPHSQIELVCSSLHKSRRITSNGSTREWDVSIFYFIFLREMRRICFR